MRCNKAVQYAVKNIRLEVSKEISDDKICSLYNQLHSSRKVGEYFNISQPYVLKILKENNIKLVSNSKAHSKYSINENYFDTIDTLSKAYILGFICADGCVTDRNELIVTVQDKDKPVVSFIQNELASTKPIRQIKRNQFIAWEFRPQNKALVNRLKELQILPRKSLILDIKKVILNSNLNDDQTRAFLLGYFDGDGGIYKCLVHEKYYQYSFSITGTFETCSYYKNYFDNIGFFTKRQKNNTNNYTYCVSGRNQVKKCLSKLYSIKEDLGFFFDRKYRIYSEL